jgi:phosphoenolpyruvate phosphomutase
MSASGHIPRERPAKLAAAPPAVSAQGSSPGGDGSPAARLRAMLDAPQLAFLMEAHDGLSARIAEVEGFEAIWASGFSISTALGVRDSDEASWTQLLAVVECMTEATSVPVVVDGDTGHGDFNTARRFVRRAERVGAAAVCFEDKQFPKMNSFVGDDHALADVGEFCGKLAACKEVQVDPAFCLIARTEALIAGCGVAEALRRAEAYRRAGADAVFVHSRRPDADEIKAFMRAWEGRLPVVIAPTTYAPSTPTDEFRRAGISAVIWANHNMRAALAAMRHVSRAIRVKESVVDLGLDLASLTEVFALMRYEELEDAEERFAHGDLRPSGEVADAGR